MAATTTGPPDGAAIYAAAMALVGRDDAQAAARLEALARAAPDDDGAPDALLGAAELAEGPLASPQHALELYRALGERYPTSRLAPRAAARRDWLAANLAAGAPPLAEYQAILRGYADRPIADSIARMERLVVATPGFPLALPARLWIAREEARRGGHEAAQQRFLAIERDAPGTATAEEAQQGRAELALAGRRPWVARRIFRALLEQGGGGAAVARAGLARAESALWQLLLSGLGLLGAAGLLTLAAWTGRGALTRPGLDFYYYLPLAALLLLAAATEEGRIARATTGIAAGGALVVWLAGAATTQRLRRGPIGRPEQLLRAAATALAVLAIAWAAVHLNGLTPLLVETLRHGPER